MKKLTKNQQEVWDRLKNGLPATGTGADFVFGTNPPNPPVPGSIWFNNATGEVFLHDGKKWTQIN